MPDKLEKLVNSFIGEHDNCFVTFSTTSSPTEYIAFIQYDNVNMRPDEVRADCMSVGDLIKYINEDSGKQGGIDSDTRLVYRDSRGFYYPIRYFQKEGGHVSVGPSEWVTRFISLQVK